MLAGAGILLFLTFRDSGFKIPGITLKGKRQDQSIPNPPLDENDYDFLKLEVVDSLSKLESAKERYTKARKEYEDALVERSQKIKEELEYVRSLDQDPVKEVKDEQKAV